MPEKILVVDDEPDLESLIRQRFRKQIRNNEYEFVFAANGLEALAKLLEHKNTGIILSDINMPEMDGLTLLAKLNELKNPALKTVIVSAYGDMDNIRTAMNRGAYDFITKPVDFTDLEMTIQKTINELSVLRKAQIEHDELLAIQYDLNIARNIQQSILPMTFPPFPEKKEFDIFASMTAAKEVGGDFYDFFMIDDERLGFVIGDVSGKGVPAAIFMAVSRTLLRATALKGLSTGECLSYVNSLLCLESASAMFVTIFYGILNSVTGEIEYSNGGHNCPYIVGKEGSVQAIPSTEGIALGVMEDITYKVSTARLNPGDTAFLFTDGVTEAFNAEEQLYSERRLENLLAQAGKADAPAQVKIVLENVQQYSEGCEQSDDITILALKYFGPQNL
jgi:sigma-B regulation protein RsbU (phosphoserine phosphatase)